MTRLCRRFRVTPAGFYAWRRRPRSAHAQQDRLLLTAITRLFTRHQGRYGSPRIHHLLVRDAWVVSRRRVARLMRTAGLRAKAVRGYRGKAGTHRFYEQHPNRLMDRYSRRILAWTLRRRRDASVTRAVLQTAVRHRRPPVGLVFHSDRGTEHRLNRSSQQWLLA